MTTTDGSPPGQPDATADIVIAVAPEVAYDAISDVRRMGEWSPEATGARLRNKKPLAVGDRFTGTNQRGPIWWRTRCEVIAADRGERFAFEVTVAGIGISLWEYRLLPDPAGTRVVESWWDRRSGPIGGLIRIGGYAFIPGDRAEHNLMNMVATLENIRAALEA